MEEGCSKLYSSWDSSISVIWGVFLRRQRTLIRNWGVKGNLKKLQQIAKSRDYDYWHLWWGRRHRKQLCQLIPIQGIVRTRISIPIKLYLHWTFKSCFYFMCLYVLPAWVDVHHVCGRGEGFPLQPHSSHTRSLLCRPRFQSFLPLALWKQISIIYYSSPSPWYFVIHDSRTSLTHLHINISQLFI